MWCSFIETHKNTTILKDSAILINKSPMDRHKGNSVDCSVIGTQKCKSWVATKFVVIEEAGVYKRRCSFGDCGKEYSRGTSHMILKRHWSRSHGDNPPMTKRSEIYKRNLGSGPGGDASGTSKSSKKPLKMMGDVGGENHRNKSGSHNASSPSNKSFSNDKVQLDVKLVAKRLKEATSIHLTFDIYTPKKGGKTYGIVTANSIGDNFEFKSVLLEYKHLPYPDDSTAIFEFLRSCIFKFNIREKIVGIASSCSTTVTNAVQEVDKRLRLSKNFGFSTVHISCFPQFVHLNVLDVLRSQETLLENVRRVVGFINNHNFTIRPLHDSDPNAQSVTVEDVNTESLENTSAPNATDSPTKATGLKLPLDMRNNWNSTYHMIETFIQQRGLIEPTILYYQNPQDSSSICLDWDKLFTLVQLLKPFHEVINKFVSENHAPVSLVAALIPHLMKHLSKSSWAYDDLVMAAHNFKMQLETYQQTFHSDLTVIAGLLDPRVKDAFLSSEGREDGISTLRKRIDIYTQNKVEAQVRYEEHMHSVWADILMPPVAVDEVADYLERTRQWVCTNTFMYWESQKKSYPGLYALAKSIACLQATSVPSDRMFSAAENTERERKIQVDSTNSKIIMKSWAKYLEK